MKIEVGMICGDFQVKADLGEKKFGCICIHCGARKKWSRVTLKKNPLCECQEETREYIKERNEGTKEILKNVGREIKRHSRDEGESDPLSSVHSMYEIYVKDINAMLERGESIEGSKLAQSKALQMMNDLIIVAEKMYRLDPKMSNGQTLTTFMTQARELMADLQADSDRGEVLEVIISNVITPGFTSMFQVVIDNMYLLRKYISDSIKDEAKAQKADDYLVTQIQNIVTAMQGVLDDVTHKIRESAE